ncbi:Cytohesin-1 [Schistosoma japonicum]|uniref:Cytohesin-1 n=1 Tax=Schistosoma japonicum TaxID=6182 RepID=A0A4Z2DPZ7_SCHJA|nr:Cytohesin-1 [Schistosoma japonicum]
MDYDDLTIEEKERLQFIRQQKTQVMKNIESLKLELSDITNQIENLGFSVDGEDSSVRRLALGCKKFNNNPKQGLEYLFDQNIIGRSPDEVAKFFIDQNDNLSKHAIGTYIGEVRKEFNMQVLDAFAKLHNFKDEEFLPALRQFLFSFQLPGESQKIDRILTSFSERYVEQNPTVFNSPHEAYVLSYAVILLNTTLHNSNAKSHSLGLAEEKTFVRTMVEFDEETNLSEDLIRKIYHAIKNEPLRAVSDDLSVCGSTQNNAVHKGWLWKLGGRVKSWKRRWFILTEDSLLYYLTPDRSRQTKGTIHLEGINIRLIHDKTKEYCFELYCPRNQLVKSCKIERDFSAGHHTVYRMAAPTLIERDEWIRMLERVTHRLAERRGTRSISVDCTGSSSSTSMTVGSGSHHHHLPPPVSSLSLRRNGAGSQPDLPSQQSASNVVKSLKTRSRVLSLYRRIFRIAETWKAQSGLNDDSFRESTYMKDEARTLFRQNAHITDQKEIENHIKEAETRIDLTLHYGTPYPRLINLPANTLAAHIMATSSPKKKSTTISSSSSSTSTGDSFVKNNGDSVKEKTRISRRTERALSNSVPNYLKSYTYRPKKEDN